MVARSSGQSMDLDYSKQFPSTLAGCAGAFAAIAAVRLRTIIGHRGGGAGSAGVRVLLLFQNRPWPTNDQCN